MFLLSEREGRTGNIWLVVTTYWLHCAWSTRHDPQSQIFSRLTRPCQSIHIYAQDCRLSRFSFLLTYFLMETYAGLCGFSRPCSSHCVHFLPGFFYVLSVLIRIRISKTHRCLLPVCKNTRVHDYHDVKQAYGYQKVFMNKYSLGVSYPVLEKRSLC